VERSASVVNVVDGCCWLCCKHALSAVLHCHGVVETAPAGAHARRAQHARSAQRNTGARHARVPQILLAPEPVQPAQTARHARVAQHARSSKHANVVIEARHVGLSRNLPRVKAWSAGAAVAFLAAAFVLAQSSAGFPRFPAVANAAAPIDTPVTYLVPASSPTSAEASPSAVIAPANWLVPAATRAPASVGVLPTPAQPTVLPAAPAWSGAGTIPRLALAAYTNAARVEAKAAPSCRLSWALLAGIGLIESDHARGGGSWNPKWTGVANPPILGPLLDGNHGYPAIVDTDHGALDGNASFDRAVGPMQFLPSTWQEYAIHAIGKGTPDPENIFDAAEAAGRYLCASKVDLATADGLIAAVYGYNHSLTYVANVLSAAQAYASNTLPGAAAALATLPTVVAPVLVSAVSLALPGTSAPVSATPAPVRPTPSPSPEPTLQPLPLPNPPAPPATNPVPSDSDTAPSGTGSPSASGSPSDSAPPSNSSSPSDTASPSNTASPTDSASPTDTASPSTDVSPTDTTSPSATTSPSDTGSPTDSTSLAPLMSSAQ
jgi:membrane-bound lytic murein transglycosylase B